MAGPQPHAAHDGASGLRLPPPRSLTLPRAEERPSLSPPRAQPDGGTCCYGRCSGRTTPAPGRSSVDRATADTAAAPPHRLPPRRPRPPPPPLPRLGSCRRRTVRGAHGRTTRTCAWGTRGADARPERRGGWGGGEARGPGRRGTPASASRRQRPAAGQGPPGRRKCGPPARWAGSRRPPPPRTLTCLAPARAPLRRRRPQAVAAPASPLAPATKTTTSMTRRRGRAPAGTRLLPALTTHAAAGGGEKRGRFWW